MSIRKQYDTDLEALKAALVEMGNNSAEATTSVTPGADLAIEKRADPTPAVAGSPVTFHVEVRILLEAARPTQKKAESAPAWKTQAGSAWNASAGTVPANEHS